MLPSGPSVAVPPRGESGNGMRSAAVIAPAVVIRPIDAGPALPLSTNQILPSGPVVIPYGVLATGIGYFVIVPGDAQADAANANITSAEQRTGTACVSRRMAA